MLVDRNNKGKDRSVATNQGEPTITGEQTKDANAKKGRKGKEEIRRTIMAHRRILGSGLGGPGALLGKSGLAP